MGGARPGLGALDQSYLIRLLDALAEAPNAVSVMKAFSPPATSAAAWIAFIDVLRSAVGAISFASIFCGASGATAVGVGRPYIWGLGAFGEAGVNRVLEILQGELKLVMGNCGTQKVADINSDYVTSRNWKN